MTRRRGSPPGFALVAVLWTLVLIAFLVATVATASRLDLRQTGNLRRATELEAAADGAINQAIFALLGQTSLDARFYAVRDITVPGGAVRLTVASEAGKLNPNIATTALLTRFFVRLGDDPVHAERVAAAIADWRTPGQAASPKGAKMPEYRAAGLNYGPPGAPFETVGEVRQVMGMTPALFAAALPHLTLWWDQPPEFEAADQVVRQAIADLGLQPVAAIGRRDADVVVLTARATDASGAVVVRRAIVRLGFSPDGRNWRVLAWDDGVT